jgi:hypothetical protein
MSSRRWTLSGFYHGAWVCLLFQAALLTWQSELIAVPLMAVSSLLALWCLVPMGRFRRLPALPRWGRLVAIGVLGLLAVEHYRHGKDLASLLGTLLWASLFIFLPRKQKPMGHWIALLVTALIALMSVIVKQEFYTHLVFLGFLLMLVFTLNANNLYSLAGASGAVRYRLSLRYFRQLAPALLWGLFGGGLVFFLFPRAQLFSNPWGLREREATTGYTGQISLQSSNAIREDATVALTIEADPQWLEQNGRGLYLRGNTVDRFEDSQWLSTEMEKWPYRIGEDIRYSLTNSHARIGAKIYREPHSTRAILYPGQLLYIRGPEGLLGGIRYDQARSLYRGVPGSLRYSYEIMFGEVPTVADLADENLDLSTFAKQWAEERALHRGNLNRPVPGTRYLQVPAVVADTEYFRDWTKEVLGDAKPARMSEILAALSLNFTRTFQPTLVHETSAATALEGFIAHGRKGHCEYFATAAALFLRAQGIPTRVVLGYRGGTFNTISKTLEVRERNAHAWVEIYGGKGRWFRYDPTPAVLEGDDTGMVAQAANYYNALKFWFNRYVVHYDSSTQQQVWMQVRLIRSSAFSGIPGWKVLLHLIRLALLTGVVWFIPRLLRRRRQRAAETLPAYYRLFLSRLERAGWPREKGETYRCYHERLRREGWDAFSLSRLDEAIHRDLYSSRPLPEGETSRLLDWVGRLSVQKKVAT